MNQIREFLKKNEIFFTTISALLLSIMAIGVTMNSNRLLKNQIEIDRFINEPDFYISNQYDLNKKYDEIMLLVRKISGSAKNIKIENTVFLNYRFEDSLKNVFKSELEIQDFFNQSLSGYKEDSNVIGILKGYKNYQRQEKLRDSLDIYLEKNGYKFIFSEINTFIKISYLDFSKKNNIEYYKSSFNDGEKLEGDYDYKLKTLTSSKQIYLDDINNMDILNIYNRLIISGKSDQ